MHKSAFAKYTYATASVAPCIICQSLHHCGMCSQQIFFAERVELVVKFIGLDGVFHFLNLAYWSYYGFSVHNVTHLVLC